MIENTGISVSHVYKSFGKETVLRDVSLTVSRGEIAGLVGNNGSGKTVLMKCICGFLRPEKGEITVGGKRIGKDCDFPPELGLIIETPGFLPSMSGYRNLRTLAALRGLIGRAEILDTLRRVGLYDARRKSVSKYSLGMRQRLGIAQAIMENPDVLILDEPFNALDAKAVAEMRALLLKLKSQGKTILLASHNAEDIRTLCDHVYEMEVQTA
ncbi:MAG: ATP-binding cassette domain-containing protein [Oscillospiraceae bacterium]|nr:ATP-binding cassette domain-containing protein [Oscillospiraceae bacterium]